MVLPSGLTTSDHQTALVPPLPEASVSSLAMFPGPLPLSNPGRYQKRMAPLTGSTRGRLVTTIGITHGTTGDELRSRQ